jgi:hypothetical protein
MTTDDRDLEMTRRLAIVLLTVLLGFAGLFLVVGAAVSMLAH